MANDVPTQKTEKSLSEKIEELFVDKMMLPRFSLPFVGSKFKDDARRILVVSEYKFCVSQSDFKKVEDASYNSNFFGRADSLIRNPEKYRVSPYALEEVGVELSSILWNISRKMSLNDVVVHRFLPYPQIKGLKESIPSRICKKAVDLFVELIDIIQPTHILFSSADALCDVEKEFKRFCRTKYGSLRNYLQNRYIFWTFWDELLDWNFYCFRCDSLEMVQYYARRALDNMEFRRRALDDPRLEPALKWDDEKIRYYGVNKAVFEVFKDKPTVVKEKLLNGSLHAKTMQDLLRPFETLRYAKILYSMPNGVVNDCYFTIDERGWELDCALISEQDQRIKEFSTFFVKPQEMYGRAKIRFLAISLHHALISLSKKLRITYESKKLDEMRCFIDDLVNETDKLYEVRKPIGQTKVSKNQKIARYMNLMKKKDTQIRENACISQKETEDKPINYTPKKKSQKQLEHLAKARSMRGRKNNSANNSNDTD